MSGRTEPDGSGHNTGDANDATSQRLLSASQPRRESRRVTTKTPSNSMPRARMLPPVARAGLAPQIPMPGPRRSFSSTRGILRLACSDPVVASSRTRCSSFSPAARGARPTSRVLTVASATGRPDPSDHRRHPCGPTPRLYARTGGGCRRRDRAQGRVRNGTGRGVSPGVARLT